MLQEIDPNAAFQQIEFPDEDYKFQTPCAISITGPSQSGKSSFIVKLIEFRQQMFTQDFKQCFYCQPANLCIRSNPIFNEIVKHFPTAELVCGLPNISKLNLDMDNSSKLVILDDLMIDVLNSSEMIQLISVEIHHSNITLLVSLHNFYCPSKHGLTFVRNLNYKIFFYNRLDLRELKAISNQVSGRSDFLHECFSFLIKTFPSQNAYVLIDGHFKSKMKSLFVRTHIFPNKEGKFQPIVFFP